MAETEQKQSLWHYVALCLLCLFALLIMAPASAQVAEDPALETRIDRYLAMVDQTPEEAERFLDEILAEINSATPVVTRVRAWGYKAVNLYYNGETEEGLRYMQRALDAAESARVPDALAEATAVKIELIRSEGDTAEALVLMPRLDEELEQTHSPRIRYYAHNLAARLYHEINQLEESLHHLLAAYEAVSETDDERTVLRRQFLNTNIAYIQSDMRNYSGALETSQRAIRVALDEGFTNQLPDLYLLRGYLEAQMEMSEASILSHEEAIRWGRELDMPGVVLVSMNNIGSTLIADGEYDRARLILEEALAEARAQENERTIFLLLFNLGYIEVMDGDPAVGIEQVREMEARLKEFYTDREYADLLKYSAEAYTKAELYLEAIEALTTQRELNEEIFRSDREQTLNELATRYEAQEQARQIELLEQRNSLQERVIENSKLQQRIFVLFVIVVVLASILLFVAYRAARKANLRLRVANKQLKYQSTHDPLTALLNRRSFQHEMAARAERIDQHIEQRYPDALLLLDVDYFKQINDNHGHSAGDTVLMELSKRLKEISRTSDMVVRWGGEEFLIYLRDMDPKKLPDFTQRVLEIIGQEPIQHEDKTIRVTATAGFISIPFAGVDEETLNWERLLQIVDMALYIGKVHGRNQGLGVMGLEVPYEQAKEMLEKDLSGAIERGWVRSIVLNGPDIPA
ncbi:MAG: diguanylate cyclase [Idiomarina sp.]|nr:diguanylate cyclase [Idiomarina sp.]